MLYTIVAVLVLVLDQAVKYWTVNNITPQAIGDACVELIPGVIHMTNVQNNGAAFSILADQRWLLIVVSAVFIIAIIALISMDIIHTKFGRWTAVLVMAGALGNCIDRVLYGYVVDMFEFEMVTFAVFNVADIFITVCGILFCIHVIIYREPEEVRAAVPPRAQRRMQEPAYEEEEDDYYEEEAPAPQRKQGRVRAREKDDPYANIPHRDRSQHRSLADELAPQDPDDPFAEWDVADFDIPAPARQAKPASRPVRRQPARPADEWDDVDLDMPVKKSAPPKKSGAPAQRPAQTKQPAKPKADPLDAGFEDFSLEDILSEFRDG